MAYAPEISTVDLLEILAMGQQTTPPDTPPSKKSPPPIPLSWAWRCHSCRTKWAFRAVNRCLTCSHRFCGECESELDFTGWNKYEAYWCDKTEGRPILKWQNDEVDETEFDESTSEDEEDEEQDEENEHEDHDMDIFEWDDDADVGSVGSGDHEGLFDPSLLYDGDDKDTNSEEHNETPTELGS